MNEKEFIITSLKSEGIYINNILISNELTEDLEYGVEDREEFIENLIRRITESKKESDKFLMKEDLKYLINLEDKYIFSSRNTNEYIAKSDNEEEFNRLCEEYLDTINF